MSNVVSLRPARVHHLKWKWLPDEWKIHDLTVGIVRSEENGPQYVVVILGTVDTFTEIAACSRNEVDALEKIRAKAAGIAALLNIVACGWKPFDPYADLPPDKAG